MVRARKDKSPKETKDDIKKLNLNEEEQTKTSPIKEKIANDAKTPTELEPNLGLDPKNDQIQTARKTLKDSKEMKDSLKEKDQKDKEQFKDKDKERIRTIQG